MSEQDHPVAERIRRTLSQALVPDSLDIVDDSARHAGHAHVTARPGGAQDASETHFKIKVVSTRFEGKSRLQRHRAINDLIADEMGPNKVHAIAIDARAPGE